MRYVQPAFIKRNILYTIVAANILFGIFAFLVNFNVEANFGNATGSDQCSGGTPLWCNCGDGRMGCFDYSATCGTRCNSDQDAGQPSQGNAKPEPDSSVKECKSNSQPKGASCSTGDNCIECQSEFCCANGQCSGPNNNCNFDTDESPDEPGEDLQIEEEDPENNTPPTTGGSCNGKLCDGSVVGPNQSTSVCGSGKVHTCDNGTRVCAGLSLVGTEACKAANIQSTNESADRVLTEREDNREEDVSENLNISFREETEPTDPTLPKCKQLDDALVGCDVSLASTNYCKVADSRQGGDSRSLHIRYDDLVAKAEAMCGEVRAGRNTNTNDRTPIRIKRGLTRVDDTVERSPQQTSEPTCAEIINSLYDKFPDDAGGKCNIQVGANGACSFTATGQIVTTVEEAIAVCNEMVNPQNEELDADAQREQVKRECTAIQNEIYNRELDFDCTVGVLDFGDIACQVVANGTHVNSAEAAINECMVYQGLIDGSIETLPSDCITIVNNVYDELGDDASSCSFSDQGETCAIKDVNGELTTLTNLGQATRLCQEVIDASTISLSGEASNDISVSAQEEPPTPDIINFDDLAAGTYELEIPGYETVTITLYQDSVAVEFFEDQNANGVQDQGEPDVDTNDFQIQISKTEEIKTYNLQTGWNLIGLPIVGERITTARQLVASLAQQGISPVQVSKYDSGNWIHYVVRVTENGNVSEYGPNFSLTPGEGYFVRTLNGGTAVLRGNTFEEGVPMSLDTGWNLRSIQSPNTYTGISFLRNCNLESIQCTQISGFDAVSQGYFSIVRDGTDFFGNDFEVQNQEGYFVKVENDGGVLIP